MKRFKNLFVATALMLALLAASGAYKPVQADGNSVGEMGITTGTAAVLIKSSAGTLWGIVQTTAPIAGLTTVCFDSATASGFTAADVTKDGVNESALTVRLADLYGSSNTIPSSAVGGFPINFNNGLVCVNSASGRARVYYK